MKMYKTLAVSYFTFRSTVGFGDRGRGFDRGRGGFDRGRGGFDRGRGGFDRGRGEGGFKRFNDGGDGGTPQNKKFKFE